jgi:hypothetical protein
MDIKNLVESYIARKDWEVKENANMGYSLRGFDMSPKLIHSKVEYLFLLKVLRSFKSELILVQQSNTIQGGY